MAVDLGEITVDLEEIVVDLGEITVDLGEVTEDLGEVNVELGDSDRFVGVLLHARVCCHDRAFHAAMTGSLYRRDRVSPASMMKSAAMIKLFLRGGFSPLPILCQRVCRQNGASLAAMMESLVRLLYTLSCLIL